jgi:hypothetical protein
MKWIIQCLLIAILAFAFNLYLPWWTIAIAAFVVAFFIPTKAGWSFLAGFVALLLLWGGMSFYISGENHHILAGKISELILKKQQPNMLILLTALVGALVGGLAALSGSLLRSITIK